MFTKKCHKFAVKISSLFLKLGSVEPKRFTVKFWDPAKQE